MDSNKLCTDNSQDTEVPSTNALAVPAVRAARGVRSHSKSPAPSAGSSSLKPRNAGNRVRKTTSSREPRPPPPPFTPEMRSQMMALLAEETAAGNLSSTKAMQRRPAFKRVALAMAESFPAFGWSALKVQNKMRDEEKRYIQFLGVTRTPGNGYDDVSGLPVASDAFWEGLLFEAPEEEWLRVEPLGDVDSYDEVFPDLRDYGQNIQSAQDMVEEARMLGNKKNTKAQGRSRNNTSAEGRNTNNTNAQLVDDAMLALARSIEKLAERNTAPGGSLEVQKATKNFCDSYQDKMDLDDLTRVIEHLVMPMNALVWNTVTSEGIRARYIAKWLNK